MISSIKTDLPDPADLPLRTLMLSSSLEEFVDALNDYVKTQKLTLPICVVQQDKKAGPIKVRYTSHAGFPSDLDLQKLTIAVNVAVASTLETEENRVVSLEAKKESSLFPLSDNGNKYGYCYIGGVPDTRQLAIVEDVAQVLGTLLERIDLLNLYSLQHEKDSIRLAGFNRITNVLKELDLDLVLNEVTSVISGNAAALQMPGNKPGELVVEVEMGLSQIQLDQIEHKEHGSISRYVVDQEVLWLTDTKEELTDFISSELLEQVSSFVVVPLHTKQETCALPIYC